MARIPQSFLDQIERDKHQSFKTGYLQAVALLLPGSQYLEKTVEWFLDPTSQTDPPTYD